MLWDPRRGARRGGVGGFWGGGNVGEAAGAPKAPEQGLMQMHKIPQLAKIPKSVPVCGSGPLVTPWGLCHGAGAALAPGVAFPPGGLRGAALCSPRSCGAEISLWGGGGGGSLPSPSICGARGGLLGPGGPWGDAGSWGRGLGGTRPPPQDREALGGEGLPGAALTPPAPIPGKWLWGFRAPSPPEVPGIVPAGGGAGAGAGDSFGLR